MKGKKALDFEALPVVLRFVPHDPGRKCNCLLTALQAVPGVSQVSVKDPEARLIFRGNWNQLYRVELAAWRARIKASLVEPAQYVLDVRPSGRPDPAALKGGLQLLPGVQQVLLSEGHAFVFAGGGQLDPRQFASCVPTYGYRLARIRSHRLRTLSYAAWESRTAPETLRDALLKNPAVLRADLDVRAGTVSVVLVRDSIKDLGLVAIGEEAGFTLFPGKAEEEDEEAPEAAEKK